MSHKIKKRRKSNAHSVPPLLHSLQRSSHCAAAAKIVGDLLSAEVAAIFLVNPENPYLLDKVASTSPYKTTISINFSPPLKPRSGLTAFHAHWYHTHVNDNEPKLLSDRDVRRHKYATGNPPKHLPSKECVSRLVIPLRDRKKLLLGLVVLDNRILRKKDEKDEKGFGQFRQEDMSLAKSVKGTLEDAIEKMRFFDTLKHVGHSVSPDVPLEKMLGRVLELAGMLLKADRGDFIGPDELGLDAKCRAQWGPKPTWFQVGDPVPYPSIMRKLLVAEENYVIAPDVEEVKHYHIVDPRTRSEVAFKFQTPQGRQYLLNLESYRANHFDEEDVRLLSLILPYVEARVAQAEGRETIALYKDLIVDNLEEMVFVKDVEGRFVFVSRKLAMFLDPANPDSVLGKTDKDYFKKHPEMVESFVKVDSEVIHSGEAKGWFEEFFQPDSQLEPRRIETYKVPVFASDKIANLIVTASGKPVRTRKAANRKVVVGVLGIFHDVSKAAHLRQAQVITRSGSIKWRKKTDSVDVSLSLLDLFGFKPSMAAQEIITRLSALIETEDRAILFKSWQALLGKVAERRKVHSFHPIRPDQPIVFKLSGQAKWYSLNYENGFDIRNDPESEYLIAGVQDVSELQSRIVSLDTLRATLTQSNSDLQRDKARIADELTSKTKTLLREAHHRIKNNFHSINSIILGQLRQNSDKQATGLLLDIIGRINTFAILHDMLSISGLKSTLQMKDYLKKLVQSLRNSYSTDTLDITCDLQCDNAQLTFDQATTCGKIVHELFRNSVRHAFPNGRKGNIQVILESKPSGSFRLSVIDDGVGLPETIQPESTTTTGLCLVNGWAKHELGGSISIGRSNGTSVCVQFSAT